MMIKPALLIPRKIQLSGSMENFALYGRYYDLLYKDKDYDAEANYVHQLFLKHKKEGKKILELGSGTGKHARLFAKKGYAVHGVERSSEMVKIASQFSVENISYEVNDIRSFHIDQSFDIAISLFHVISYLTDNADLIATFSNIAKHLNPGGLFIFDTWYTPAVYHQQPETRIKRLEDSEYNITRLAEPVIHNRENIVDVNYEVIIQNKRDQSFTTLREKHPMRHFSEPEIGLLASCTGFNLIKAEEFLTGQTPGTATWGVCFILQKQ